MMLNLVDKIRSIPAVRFLFFLIIGSNIAGFELPYMGFNLIITFILFAVLVFLFVMNTISHARQWILGILYCTLVVSLSFLLSRVNGPVSVPEKLRGSWLAVVKTMNIEKENSVKQQVRLLCAADGNVNFPGKLDVMIYYEKTDTIYPVPGDVVIINGSLEKPLNQGNPLEFDYAGYLLSKGIYYQIYIPEERWSILKKGYKKLFFFPELIRIKLLKWIDGVGGGEQALAVLKAITLGSKDFMDDQQKQSWADAGGIHIMAVSGLHVGMLWAFMSSLLGFMHRKRVSRIMKMIIILLVLWFYAMMTGLSASVIRSCLMFSMVSIGRMLNRSSPVLNTVLVAASVQILLDPISIHDAGFRFSYLAVLSIIIFQPLMGRKIPAKYLITRKIIDLISVSLAAQILTFPLVIFYFHRFPLYFLITNLMLIPLVTILMFIFLMACFLFLITGSGSLFIKLDIQVASLMNHLVQFIESLPGSVIENLTISSVQLLILLLIPFLWLLFSRSRRLCYLTTSFVLLILFLATGIIRYHRCNTSYSFYVHNIRDIPLCSYSVNGKMYYFSHNSIENYLESIKYITENYRIQHYRKEKLFIDNDLPYSKTMQEFRITAFPDKANYMISISDKRIFLLFDPDLLQNWQSPIALNLDYLVVCCESLPRPKLLESMFVFDRLIISSSVKSYFNYEDSVFSKEVAVIDVRRSGASLLFTDRVSNKKSLKALGYF